MPFIELPSNPIGAFVYDYAPGSGFSETGVIALAVGLAILVLSNGLAYLIIKSFNLQSYYGRFLGGVIILFFTLLLSLSTESFVRFKSAVIFGLGEIIIGTLDIVSDRLSTSLPLLIPDPGC
jgi:hypothetical protein